MSDSIRVKRWIQLHVSPQQKKAIDYNAANNQRAQSQQVSSQLRPNSPDNFGDRRHQCDHDEFEEHHSPDSPLMQNPARDWIPFDQDIVRSALGTVS